MRHCNCTSTSHTHTVRQNLRLTIPQRPMVGSRRRAQGDFVEKIKEEAQRAYKMKEKEKAKEKGGVKASY
jgi:hypothetical protein